MCLLQVLVELLAFRTEECCDYVEVYDGPDDTYPVLAKLQGLGGRSVLSSTHQVLIKFVSDVNTVDTGFKLLVSPYTGEYLKNKFQCDI